MKTNENYDIKRIIEYISILDEYEIQLANKIEIERLNKEAFDDKYQSEEKNYLLRH